METDWKKKYEDAMARMELCERTGLEKKPDYIFPELRESEDERIRKEIIDFVNHYRHNTDLTTEQVEWCKKAIVYLEKQKAKERLDRMAPIYNDKESFESALEKAWKYYNESASRTVDSFEDDYIECVFSKGFREGFLYKEKQKEQKPTELEQLAKLREMTHEIRDAYERGIEVGRVESQQEWSDEDKRMLNAASSVLKSVGHDTLANYLLKLKHLQPVKQEWSEDWREEDIQTRFAFYTYKNEEDDGVLYLSNVFVEEASRNHGFGTRILRAAEKVAETIGATTICLKVKQDSPANAWYRKNGYGYVAFEDDYDWLEKNLEYMKPQPKQEWSEEEIRTILDDFAECKDTYTSCVNRLKSLRPQS